MKRLLFVDHAPFSGGAQLVLAQHIAHLNKDKFEAHVLCSNTVPLLIDRFEQAGATVHLAEFPRLRGLNFKSMVGLWRVSAQMRQLIWSKQIDLVVANTERAAYISSLAVISTGVPLIWWVRDFVYSKNLFKVLHRIPRRIIYVSKAIRDHYVSPRDSQGVVIYVASDLVDRLKLVKPAEVVAERKRWGFTPKDVVVGFMGRLVAEKGAADLIEAVGQLSSSYPQLKLLVVGSGKGQANDVEAELQQMVKDKKWESTIVFAGYQTNEPLYYLLFDLFALTTRDHEAFATTVVQAMMAGKPVIGTDAGGTKELVINDQTGLLVAPHQVSALIKALTELLENPAKRQKMALAGQARVLQYHQESYTTEELERLYISVMS